jgi:hypothetical protein
MRQGKLSELIHNSANYPDLDECKVEVHFQEIIDLVRSPDIFVLSVYLHPYVARPGRVQSRCKLILGRLPYRVQEQLFALHNQ